MRINIGVRLDGERCTLVPYATEMVEQYHTWMLNDENREMTCSEPLSLAEEYKMCADWQVDEDKLTFIILDRAFEDTPGLRDICSGGGRMAGDVNLFFNDHYDKQVAEIDVMVEENNQFNIFKLDPNHFLKI